MGDLGCFLYNAAQVNVSINNKQMKNVHYTTKQYQTVIIHILNGGWWCKKKDDDDDACLKVRQTDKRPLRKKTKAKLLVQWFRIGDCL